MYSSRAAEVLDLREGAEEIECEDCWTGRRRNFTHLVGGARDDAHDGGEAPPAQRTAAPLIPQHVSALDAEPAMAALEQDGVGGPLHAHDAGGTAVIYFSILLCFAAGQATFSDMVFSAFLRRVGIVRHSVPHSKA